MNAKRALTVLKATAFATLYGALIVGATPAPPAAAADLSASQVETLKAARSGDMKKLVIHKEPRPRLERAFETAKGGSRTIEDFSGKVMLVNFWATWCPPCRKEMPYLDNLRAEMRNDDFDVIAISMDRASVEKIERFYMSADLRNLDIYREPTLRIGTEAGILGMPVTIVLDRRGREIARLQGEAKWDSSEAKDMLRALIDAVDAAPGS